MREERYGRKTRQRAPKPPFGFWLFIRGFGGETCPLCTCSHWCNLRDLGPSRRRKLHILRFAFRGKSSVIPLLLLSPPNPLRWALAGPPFCTASTDSCLLHQLLLKRWHLMNAARRAHGSSAEHAMRDLIASHAPLRTRRHTARQYGPKHYPRGFKGPQPLGTPFSPIFRRATKDGATGGRWFSREVGKKRTTKDGAVGDRRSSIAASNKIKPQNSP